MTRQNRLLQVITELYIIVALWGAIKTKSESNGGFYVVTVLYVIVFAVYMSQRTMHIYLDRINGISLSMAGVWIYGCILGLLQRNNPAYVLRNFSGMLLYMTSYLLINSGISLERLSRMLLKMSVWMTLLTPVAHFLLFVVPGQKGWFLLKIPFLNCLATGIQSIGFTVVYNGAHILLPISYSYCLYQCFSKDRYINRYSFFALFDLLIAFFWGQSGGLELELLVLTGVMFLVSARKKLTEKKAFIVYCIFSLMIIYILKAGARSVLGIFDPSDGGNSLRYKQIDHILHNLSFLGQGLGAEYTAIGKGYGIEFIHGDLIYKLGVFGLIPIGIYVYTWILSLKILVRTKGDWTDVIPIALMSYIFYALGNPVLFSGGSVIAHILALMYIKNKQQDHPKAAACSTKYAIWNRADMNRERI